MATEAKALELPEEIAQAVRRGERVVGTSAGETLAAVVSLEDLRRLEAIEAEEDRIDAEAVRERQSEPAAPWDEVRARLGL